MIGIAAAADGGRLQQKPLRDVEVCKLFISLGCASVEGDFVGNRCRNVRRSSPRSRCGSEVEVRVCGSEDGATENFKVTPQS